MANRWYARWLKTFMVASVAFYAPAAFASTGVNIAPAEFKVATSVVQGSDGILPPITVRNTGTSAETFRIATYGYMASDHTAFTLPAGHAESIQLNLSVPLNAVPGDHRDSFRVTANSRNSMNYASVVGRIEYNVRSLTFFARVGKEVQDNLSISPWVLVALLAALMVGRKIREKRKGMARR